MKDLKDYNLNSKTFLREIVESSKNDFPKEMKLAKESNPGKFAKYSETSKTISAELFVAICEHFCLSHQRIIEKIIAHCNITDIDEARRIANWLGLKLPKADEEFIQNFGMKQ